MESNKLGYLIPYHDHNDENAQALKACAASIAEQDKHSRIFVVCPEGIGVSESDMEAMLDGKAECIMHSEGSDIATQLNVGAASMDTDYVAYIEFDDRVNKNYRDVFDDHISEYPDLGILLALHVKSDWESGKIMNYGNVAFWSALYSTEDSELGSITLSGLEYIKEEPLFAKSISLSGAAIKRVAFTEHGGIKKNIKFTFMYEFLIRMIYEGMETKIGTQVTYLHSENRKGSFSMGNLGVASNKDYASYIDRCHTEYMKNAEG